MKTHITVLSPILISYNNPSMQPASIQSTHEIRHILKDNLTTLTHRFCVTKIGIFGSYSRGEQTLVSDLDILVDLAPSGKTLRNFVALADYLESLLDKKVDLVTHDGLDPYIRPYVEREVIWIE